MRARSRHARVARKRGCRKCFTVSAMFSRVDYNRRSKRVTGVKVHLLLIRKECYAARGIPETMPEIPGFDEVRYYEF